MARALPSTGSSPSSAPGAALGDHVGGHPADWHVLRTPPTVDLLPNRAGDARELLAAVAPDLGPLTALDALRVVYRRLLLAIAAADLVARVPDDSMARVGGALADLAGAALEAALPRARVELPADRLALPVRRLGLGKCGGEELNYVSDVDVVYVAEPSTEGRSRGSRAAECRKLAAAVVRICSTATPEGTLWPVDAALRPEGKAGPLVRTLASHRAYYRRWAETWEFQALLKARPVAGDRELGEAYAEMAAPLVWSAADRPDFVEDVRAMRRRVEASFRRPEASGN